MPSTTARRNLWAIASVVALCGVAPRVQAQVCEDDAGLVCDEDAGLWEDDAGAAGQAGTDAMSHAGSGGTGAAGAGAPDIDAGLGSDETQCSCEANISSEQGRIHVCTGGDTRGVCARFSCERGVVRYDACKATDIQACCVIPSRGLISVLYDDCTHPNCLSGFTAQCEDFSGTLHGQDCAELIGHSSKSHGGGGGCAVATGRAPATDATRAANDAGAVLSALGLLWLRRRRMRRA